MEIIGFVVVVVLAYIVYLGVKFTNFKARLMNELGRRGVPFDMADDIYFRQGDRINNLHHDGMPVDQIVDKLMGTQPSVSGNASRAGLDSGPQKESDASLEETKRKFAIANFVADSLAVQKALFQSADGSLPEKALDHWSLGYVGGTADAVLQKNDIKLDDEAMTTLMHVFVEVFGNRFGPKMLGNFMMLQATGNMSVNAGMETGGQEMFAWMADNDKIPTGWMAYVRSLDDD